MPSAEQILQQLSLLANSARGVALFWHLAILLMLLGLAVTRKSPRMPLAAAVAVGPIISACVLAVTVRNPFNAVLLGLFSIALLVLAARLSAAPIERGPLWSGTLGAASVAYGLVYPHFIEVRSWTDLWFAPAGVVPCPSLALAIGFGLLAGGFGSRAWSLTAAAAGAFYALFGMFRLGVWLDVGLLIASGALAVRSLRTRRSVNDALRFA
jgi:hypothetical protein